MADDATGPYLLHSAVRRDLVDSLANLPGASRDTGLTAAELGESVGLHVSTVRFHLDQLEGAGLVTSHLVRGTGAGRPRKHYAVSQGRLPDVADHQHLLAELLAETYLPDAAGLTSTPEEAGRRWVEQRVPPTDEPPATSAGAWLGKIGHVVDVLAEWGYTPHLTTSNQGRTAEIELVDCPFLSLARNHPQVVCGIHRGLLRGALERVGEPDAEISLEPFVGPTQCRAHATTRSPFTRAPRPGAPS